MRCGGEAVLPHIGSSVTYHCIKGCADRRTKKDSVDGSRMIQNENLVNWDTLAHRKREITKCLVKKDSFFSFLLCICVRSLDPSGTTVQTRQHPDFHVAVSARNRLSES